MIKVTEAKGDTIEAALQNALAQLGLDRDDTTYEYEVVKRPKSGFLGFGKEPAVVRVKLEVSPAGKAKDFLEGLLIRFGAPADIRVTEDDEEKTIHLELSGPNMGAVIGRRGDTLDALQYLTSIVTNKDEDDRWRVTVDTENYRAKRETSLVQLAKKTAQKALKYRKSVALEPMNPHERRIIHSALQEVDGVTTYSTGNEPNRKVIVAPTDAEGQAARRKADGKPETAENSEQADKPAKSGSSRRRRRRPRRPKTEE